jgi:hypothetical protein
MSWLFPLKAFREMHGDEGGEVNASTPIVESWFETLARPSWGATCSGGREMDGGMTFDFVTEPAATAARLLRRRDEQA